MSSLLYIHQALISVFNKSKVINFAQKLSKVGIKLLSTTGTTETLSKYGVLAQNISNYTQFPEIMNGRIKTLHHKIYASILNRPKLDDDILRKYCIQPINMIVIDFYPFKKILKTQQYSQEEILEYIDIGGPSMVRAAIKNYKNTTVIVDYHDYDNIIEELKKTGGLISLETRFDLAAKALQHIINYDKDIANYFHKQLRIPNNISKYNDMSSNNHFPNTIQCMNLQFKKSHNICYGENPHQKAALYKEINTPQTNGSIVYPYQLQGKPLSYNNIIDIDTALECVKIFDDPTCVIVKHANPCGVATSNTIAEAYKKAYQSDPISAFGGIIAINRNLDIFTMQHITNHKHFIEAIIAPDINQDCLKTLSNKKHTKILCVGNILNKKSSNTIDIDFKRITGGLLIQHKNNETYPKHLDTVTITQPSTQEIQDAIFCWKIVKFVKSNAIVCGKNFQTLGIGSGQLNRVNAVKIATTSAKTYNAENLTGSVLASDAFFPFPDGIHIAAKMGIRCIIQPGGSIRDSEIIKVSNQYGISMIFTHIRHFRH